MINMSGWLAPGSADGVTYVTHRCGEYTSVRLCRPRVKAHDGACGLCFGLVLSKPCSWSVDPFNVRCFG